MSQPMLEWKQLAQTAESFAVQISFIRCETVAEARLALL